MPLRPQPGPAEPRCRSSACAISDPAETRPDQEKKKEKLGALRKKKSKLWSCPSSSRGFAGGRPAAPLPGQGAEGPGGGGDPKSRRRGPGSPEPHPDPGLPGSAPHRRPSGVAGSAHKGGGSGPGGAAPGSAGGSGASAGSRGRAGAEPAPQPPAAPRSPRSLPVSVPSPAARLRNGNIYVN